MTKNQKHKNSS